MKLLDNLFGVAHIATSMMALSEYKEKIERFKAEGKFEEERQVIADACHTWTNTLIKHFKTEIDVINPENLPEKGPAVYVCNHQSYADILVLANIIKHQAGFIAKKELSNIPMFSKWTARIESLFITRNDARESLRIINEGAEMVKNGYSLIIFPEGTRSRGSQMSEFKPGSLKLATKARAKVVPITVNGTYRMFEETGSITKNVKVRVVVHEAIETAQMDRKELAGLSDRVEEIIKSAVVKE